MPFSQFYIMRVIFTSVKLFLSICVVVSTAPTSNDKDTLVLLHVLFRHGNRTPDKGSLFPNDLYLNETYAPYGYGQLTTKGKQTEYAIGKYLRATYGRFIPDQYTPNVVYSHSTNFKRTKMSLELVLASLFPPLTSERILSNLNWQPLPFIIEEDPRLLTVPSLYCVNYVNAYYNYILSREARNTINSYKNLYEKLTLVAGFDVLTPKDVSNIYFTLKSEDDFGLKLPEWSSDIYPKILEEAASVDYEFSTANAKLKKLTAGFLIKKITQDTLAKKNGTLPKERKVFLYSAHEFNVATTLRALDVFYRHVPPFGATIFFEIHNINGVYGLKLFYQDYSVLDPRQLVIPGCETFCPLDEFIELVSESIPTENDVCNTIGEIS